MILGSKARPAIRGGAILIGGLLLTALTALAAGDVAGGLAGVSLVRYAFGTVVAVAVLLLGARWLRRYSAAQGIAADALRIVASLPVGQRERVVVVQIGERQLLLGVAPGRVALLHALDEALPAERPNQTAELPGTAWLARVLKA